MAGNEIADSTDWLSTPLSALTPLESALRCQICKDFYETPMITTCSHTFCSLCIRRALSAEGKCPLCRSNEQELRLRSNWSMEEAVEAFKKARADVLALAQRPQQTERSPKRKADNIEEGEGKPAETKRLRSSARLSQNRAHAPPSYAPEAGEDEIIPVSDHEDDYVPEPADGLVPCPSCQKRMKEWQVFAHLEKCPGPESNSKREPPTTNTTSQSSGTRQHQKTLDRLPALNYGMYKDTALRKKLQDLGLPNYGPRNLMERRHKEWITLWNANCDAARPKKRSELMQDLDMWERTQGTRANTTGKAAHNAALIKDKDFDGGAWAAKHDNSFKDLIANARKSVQKKKPQEEEDTSDPPRPETTDHATNGTDTTAFMFTAAGTTTPGSLAAPATALAQDLRYQPPLPQQSPESQTELYEKEPPGMLDIRDVDDGSFVRFEPFVVERVRSGIEPSPEQIERWRLPIGKRFPDLPNDSSERLIDREQFRQYRGVRNYLAAKGIDVPRLWSDMSLEEERDRFQRTEEEYERKYSQKKDTSDQLQP